MAMPGSWPPGDEPEQAGADDEIAAEEELALAGLDDRLPWLESGDEEEEERGVDTGRIVAFALVGLLGVGLVLGAVWWLSRERPQGEAIAEGGVIEAPEGPYKVRPDDPGGRQVAGTGDTSFAVAEGRQIEGRIASPAGATAVPSPSIDRTQADAPAAGGSVGVQVGAYSTKARAEEGWNVLVARLEPLQGRSHRVVEGMADGSPVFRLQALAGSAAEADALCRSIKAAGGDCQVKR